MQAEQESAPSCRLRVYLYGPLEVWKREVSGTWTRVEKGAWGKGRVGRSVFKRLLAAPGRRLSRGAIQDDLWPDSGDFELAEKSTYNAINQIRRVVGKTLVRTIEASYELADHSVLWLDCDACETLLKEAENRGHNSAQALPLLEEALGYLERGELLEGESGIWVYGLRKKSEDLLRQCRLWLAEAYEAQGKLWQAGEQYRALLQPMPPDEEALQAWVAMLQRQGKQQEACKCYQDIKGIVEAQGFTLSPAIEEAVLSLNGQPYRTLLVTSEMLPGGLSVELEEQRLFRPAEHETLIPIHLGIVSLSLEDPTAQFGEKLAHLLTVVEDYCGHPTFCLELQDKIGKELSSMQPKADDEGYTRSRRQVLITLANLPTALLLTILQGRRSAGRIEQFLTRCAASLTACWHLMRGREYAVVEELLSMYLPLLVSLAQESSKYQSTAASLATQAYRLKGILALHRNEFKARDAYCQQAVYYAEITHNPSLLVAALSSLAYHKPHPVEAEQLYQKAVVYEQAVSPLQRSRLYAQLSVACAQQNRVDDTMQYLHLAEQEYPMHPENDPSFLYADFCPGSMVREKGRVYLALNEHEPDGYYPQQAWGTFASVEAGPSKLVIPERIRYEIVNYQAETALALQDRDLCCDYLEQGARGAVALGSVKRRKEVIVVRNKALKLWPHDARVKELKYLFA